ncbi:nectin-1 isoform X3 [Chaetodon auriga]|uniref:nectin-1 isoform X3 n=1 Tax=Chaetodon auriga TaxID=39042 RepID=UPI004032B73E
MKTSQRHGDKRALEVTGGNMTVALGETAVLPCKLTGTSEPITQISWQRVTRGRPQKENFLTIIPKDGLKPVNGHVGRFTFIGSISSNDGSLQLASVELMDEGIYTCIFTLFPSGNHGADILLNLLVPPISSLKGNLLALGSEEVDLVTCTAAGSRPPAQVRWLTGTLAGKVRITNSSTEHPNGTTTTVSSLFGVPTREMNQHVVRCVVTNAALSKEETLAFTIQVYFSPLEVSIRQQAKDSFECVTEANPRASFTWNSSRVLRTCASQLSVTLGHLFNLSLSLQRVPVLWKMSCVVPVPEKKSPSGPNDYRPVVLTSLMMKVLERLVQGTVLSPFLFTLYTSDFQYNSSSCHLQKFSDDSAVVGCMKDGREEEYRAVVDNFVEWSGRNHLLLNAAKTN